MHNPPTFSISILLALTLFSCSSYVERKDLSPVDLRSIESVYIDQDIPIAFGPYTNTYSEMLGPPVGYDFQSSMEEGLKKEDHIQLQKMFDENNIDFTAMLVEELKNKLSARNAFKIVDTPDQAQAVFKVRIDKYVFLESKKKSEYNRGVAVRASASLDRNEADSPARLWQTIWLEIGIEYIDSITPESILAKSEPENARELLLELAQELANLFVKNMFRRIPGSSSS